MPIQTPRPIDPERYSAPAIVFPWDAHRDSRALRAREWLVTNGLGGYASGTLLGEATRRYHGLFVPNLPAPRGRTVMLPRLDDWIRQDGTMIQLSGGELTGGRTVGRGSEFLQQFRLEWLVPCWTYQIGRRRLRKRITMPYGQSTVYIEYRLLEGPAATLHLRPYVTFRGHDDRLGHPDEWRFPTTFVGDRFEVRAHDGAPPLKFCLRPAEGVFVAAPRTIEDVYYPVEEERGLDFTESLFSPGYFSLELKAGESVALAASVEPWEYLGLTPEMIFRAEEERLQKLLDRAAPAARVGWARHLVLAADQFIVAPGSRSEENALLQASGDRVRTVIAGYHWFTDWGRDTMISLEGLTICTGRLQEARAILRTFSHYIRDGLLPNLFPEGQREAVYHTADATFWYFHALDRYLKASSDRETLEHLFPILQTIIDHHRRGTRFGIRRDADGLITQGSPDWPLTWMDAKADDWIVTPRRGKPVEIQALWYNALRLMEDWSKELGKPPGDYHQMAAEAQACFNRRFWYEAGGYLYDLVDGEQGDDRTLRPNQILAISLRHPVLAEDRWKRIVEVVGHRLWTPVGLRSLDPEDPEYKPRYAGDRRQRDGAYHQGLVWGWLIGPYVDAWRRVHGRGENTAHLMKGLEEHLREAGVGTISEIFDAEPPHRPRACIAQAWSVAEALRILVDSGADQEETAARGQVVRAPQERRQQKKSDPL